ncbi:MAG: hypothetical protein CMG66_04190 [Candidatus Marinimicrobia bacterium]|nr:hypothetical protein [Candidatus Neomarinimicrobiota bacterium]|tara:strand:- start:14002 stop:14730 length:729 start_codon:yes stop_codon:yes gene_type:complete
MKKNKTKINTFFYILIILLINIGISKYLLSIKAFNIDTIQISGNQYITNENLLRLIQNNTNNSNILNIKLKNLNSELQKDEFISHVKSYTKFPSSLTVEIEEITPLALFERNQKFYFMDQSKKIIEANYKAINHYINTPIITNLSNEKINLNNIRYLLIEILNHSNIVYEKLNEVQYLDENIILILDNNTKIILKNDHYKHNLNKFLSFNKQVIVKNNIDINVYKYIDLSIPEQIIIREKNI